MARSACRERPVKIEIYDQSYNVNAARTKNIVKELAAYVDAKMRDVAEATRTVDSLKVAVLAALEYCRRDVHFARAPAEDRGSPAEARREMRRAGGKGPGPRRISGEYLSGFRTTACTTTLWPLVLRASTI